MKRPGFDPAFRRCAECTNKIRRIVDACGTLIGDMYARGLVCWNCHPRASGRPVPPALAAKVTEAARLVLGAIVAERIKVLLCPACAAKLRAAESLGGTDAARAFALQTVEACPECRKQLPHEPEPDQAHNVRRMKPS